MWLVFGLLLALVILFTLLGTLLWAPKQQNGGFLIGGKGDQTIVYSQGGEDWSVAVDSNGNIPFGSSGETTFLDYGSGVWVAVADPNSASGETIAWSGDGKTWNYGTGENFSGSATSLGRAVEYANGIWVAGGTTKDTSKSTLLWSIDGKDWSSATNDPFGTTTNGTCDGLFYGGDLWLAGGTDGTSGVNVWWSTDGKSWTAATGNPFGSASNSGVGRFAYGNGRYVGCGASYGGNDNPLWYSDNGKHWVETTNQFGNVAGKDVKYANGLFVATSQYLSDSNSMIQYSTDGKTFVPATVPGTFTSGAAFNNVVGREDSFWLAWGRNGSQGIIYKSEDGRTWEDVTPSGAFPTSASFVSSGVWGKYNGNWRFVIAGEATSGSNIWWTEDGNNWTEANNAPLGSGAGKDGTETVWSGLKV